MAFPRNKSTLAHRSGEVPAPTNSPQKPTNRLSELPETQDSGSPFPKASPLTRYASRHIDVTLDDSTRHICCAGRCNYGPGCTREIEAFYELATEPA